MHPIFDEIRKQLRRTGREGSVGWQPEQWWEAFVFMFYYGPKHASQPEADDLLFLVMGPVFRTSEVPYTVIRRLEELPNEFHKGGTQYEKIDWRSTLELNLVMQTTYNIVVAVRDPGEHLFGGPFRSTNLDNAEVSKAVHASTVTESLDAKHKKCDRPSICYPDICFAVDDYEDAFNSLVISDDEQKFVVLLTANPYDDADEEPVTSKEAMKKPVDDGRRQGEDEMHDPLINPKASHASTVSIEEGCPDNVRSCGCRIFAGAVTFEKVKDGLLGKDHCVPRRILQERVLQLKSQDGDGKAEIFTSIDASEQRPRSPISLPKRPLSLNDRSVFLRRSIQSARDLFRSFRSDQAILNITEESKLKFSCSLMTLKLPVDVVAKKILEALP